MCDLGKGKVIIASDWSTCIYDFYKDGNPLDVAMAPWWLYAGPQTVCKVNDDVMIAGANGMYNTSIENLLDGTMGDDGYKHWGGGITLPDISTFMICSINHDEKSNRVYAGGWTEFKSPSGYVAPGTGLHVSVDGGKSFYKYYLYEQMMCPNGPMAINTIESIWYRGHNLVFVGGEGCSTLTHKYSVKDFPFFFILMDDKLYDLELTNNIGLAQAGGY